MKSEHQKREMSSQEIEQHLKAAVDELAPDIFDKLDLSMPQQKTELDIGREKIVSLQQRGERYRTEFTGKTGQSGSL